MHSITLKNIPPDLYVRIKKTAQENKRSINNEILPRLDRSLQSSRIDPDSFLKNLDDYHSRLNIPPLTDEILKQAKEEGRA